jgi:ribosomal protein S18 acetylase RimI-like enzyme
VAAIPLHTWFRNLLEKSEFIRTYNIIVLSWKRGVEWELPTRSSLLIRTMQPGDLDGVAAVDVKAFGRVWQNSRDSLEIAFRQAAVATVALEGDEIVGYQISTATPMGGHLARLAIDPVKQGKGTGYALLVDLLAKFEQRGAQSVTVNTQQDNLVSLKLYQKAGFKRTGEEYPVYQFPIDGMV